MKQTTKFFLLIAMQQKIFVKELESGKTIVNYKAGFYRGFMGNDPPEELNDENSKKSKIIYYKIIRGIKKDCRD